MKRKRLKCLIYLMIFMIFLCVRITLLFSMKILLFASILLICFKGLNKRLIYL